MAQAGLGYAPTHEAVQAGLNDPLTMREQQQAAALAAYRGAPTDLTAGTHLPPAPVSAGLSTPYGLFGATPDPAAADQPPDDPSVGVGGELLYGTRQNAEDLLAGAGRLAKDHLGFEAVGDALIDAGDFVGPSDEQEAAQQRQAQARADAVAAGQKSAPRAFVEDAGDAIVQTFPQFGTTIAAGAAGGAALGSVIPGFGTIVGGIIGAAATTIPTMYNQAIRGAKEAGADVSDPEVQKRALTVTAIQSAMEVVTPLHILGKLGTLGKKTAEHLATQSVLKRGVKEFLKDGASEGLTEVGQQAVQEIAFNPELRQHLQQDDIQQLVPWVTETFGREAALNFVAGAGMGGPLGGAAGSYQQGMVNADRANDVKRLVKIAGEAGVPVEALEAAAKDPKKAGVLRSAALDIKQAELARSAAQQLSDATPGSDATTQLAAKAHTRADAVLDKYLPQFGGKTVAQMAADRAAIAKQRDAEVRQKAADLGFAPKPEVTTEQIDRNISALQQAQSARKDAQEALVNARKPTKRLRAQAQLDAALEAEAQARNDVHRHVEGMNAQDARKATVDWRHGAVEAERREPAVQRQYERLFTPDMTPEQTAHRALDVMDKYEPAKNEGSKQLRKTIDRLQRRLDRAGSADEIDNLEREIADKTARLGRPAPIYTAAERALASLPEGTVSAARQIRAEAAAAAIAKPDATATPSDAEPKAKAKPVEGTAPATEVTEESGAEAKAAPTSETKEPAPSTVRVTSTPEQIEEQRAAVHPAPSQPQTEAGNYAKGHVKVHGLDISIETPKGGVRTGISPEGKPWSVKMQYDYGYIRRTEGADDDHADVYIGPKPDARNAYVIDQVDPTTKAFDEHKHILGSTNALQARRIYNSGFSDGSGPRRVGAITEMPIEEFRQWVQSEAAKAPLDPQIKTATKLAQKEPSRPSTPAIDAAIAAPEPAPVVSPTGVEEPSGPEVTTTSLTPPQVSTAAPTTEGEAVRELPPPTSEVRVGHSVDQQNPWRDEHDKLPPGPVTPEQADALVREWGRDGNEHSLVIGSNGTVISAGTNGHKNAVVYSRMANRLRADPNAGLTFTHNHPINVVASLADANLLLRSPGFKEVRIAAMKPDGSPGLHQVITRGPNAAWALHQDGGRGPRLIDTAIQGLGLHRNDLVDKLVAAGLNRDMALQVLSRGTLQGLADNGLIDIQTTNDDMVFSPDERKLIEEIRADAREVVRRIIVNRGLTRGEGTADQAVRTPGRGRGLRPDDAGRGEGPPGGTGEPGRVRPAGPGSPGGEGLSAPEGGPPVARQSVTLREGTEDLAKYGIKPGKRHSTRAIAAALEQRQRDKYGRISRVDRSPEARAKIADWMTTEVSYEAALATAGRHSALGWYSTKFQSALDAMATVFPEFKGEMKGTAFTSPAEARNYMTALVAITSAGEKVIANWRRAAKLYNVARTTGQTPTDIQAMQGLGMRTNAAILNKLHAEKGPGLRDYLVEQVRVGDLNKQLKAMGMSPTPYSADALMPRSAVYFGAKLGAFYANLSGSEGYLTMDRWWSRTFNRYRGELLSKPTKAGMNRVRGLIAADKGVAPESLSDDQVLALLSPYVDAYAAKGFKNGTEIEKAANTVYKAAFKDTLDTPFGAKDRDFMIAAATEAQAKLAAQGLPISLADIQAALWYYEKRLYGRLGAKPTADISFEEVAGQIASEMQSEPGAPPIYPTEKPIPHPDMDLRTQAEREQEIPAQVQAYADQNEPGEYLPTDVAAATRIVVNNGGSIPEVLRAVKRQAEDETNGIPELPGGPGRGGPAGAGNVAAPDGLGSFPAGRIPWFDDPVAVAAESGASLGVYTPGPGQPGADAPTTGERPGRGSGLDYERTAGADARELPERAPLDGAPAGVRPNRKIAATAEQYLREHGIPLRRQKAYVKPDADRGKRIADEFDKMPDDLDAPGVREAYTQLAKEVIDQYRAAIGSGLQVSMITPDMGDPYPEGPKQALEDLRHGHLWFYPTESGFGTLNEADQSSPMLEPTEFMVGNHRMLVNDLFRVVHDYFGHGREGVGFAAGGEENTWQSHVRMFTSQAAHAMTSETRGQNSWVNFGPYGEHNRLNPRETVFADQKLGLLPEWTMTEALEDDDGGPDGGGEALVARATDPFYSAALRAVGNIPQEKATGEQWLAMLRKQPNVKQEELDWTGLPTWLSDRKGVTKQEVADYLAANQVRVQEVMKGEGLGFKDLGITFEQRDGRWAAIQDGGEIGRWRTRALAEARAQEYVEETQAEEENPTKFSQHTLPGGNNYRELLITMPQRRYSLKKLGSGGYAIRDNEQNHFIRDAGGAGRSFASEADAQAEIKHLVSIGRGDSTEYKSAHWDEPNVLAHIRFNERTVPVPFTAEEQAAEKAWADAQGEMERMSAERAKALKARSVEREAAFRENQRRVLDRLDRKEITTRQAQDLIEQYEAPSSSRLEDARAADAKIEAFRKTLPPQPRQKKERVLFIEEIQSDWHQTGRRKGYSTPPNPRIVALKAQIADLRRQADAIMAEYPEPDLGRPQDPEEKARLAPLQERMNAAEAEFRALGGWNVDERIGTVPDAPLKSTWHETAFRRAISYATENGFDRVAWTPGEMQAERYDLSKQVSRVRYDAPGKRLYAYDHSNTTVLDTAISDPKQIEDHIGKEVAKKLLEAPVDAYGMHDLHGVDLKVGGEGMVGFYDRILPAYARKWGKKFGAEVGTTNLTETGNGALIQVDEKLERGAPGSFIVFTGRNQREGKILGRFDTLAEAKAFEMSLGTEVWSMPITPAMRETLPTEGTPLFAASPTFPEYPAYLQGPGHSPARAAYQAAVANVRQPKLALTGWLKNMETLTVNQFAPIRHLEEAMRGHLGTGMESAFKAAEVAINDSGRNETLMLYGAGDIDEHGAFRPRAGTIGLKAMLDKLHAGQGADGIRDFQEFMAARRAQQLEARDIKTPLTPADIAAGLAKETPLIREVADDWKRHNDANVDLLVKTGRIAPALGVALKADAAYVPFYRTDQRVDGAPELFDEFGLRHVTEHSAVGKRRLANANPGIHKIVGGEVLKLNNIVDNMIRNSQAMVAAAMRNNAANLSFDLMHEAGLVTHQRGFKMGKSGKVISVAKPNPSAVKMWRNGKEWWLVPTDPAAEPMFTALAGFTPVQLSGLARLMANMASIFRQGITLSPAFMVRNLIRGMVSTGVLTSGANLRLTNNVFTGATDSLRRGAGRQVFSAMSGMGDFRFGGHDLGLGKNDWMVDYGQAPATLGSRWRKVIDKMEAVGTATEVGDRIAAMNTMIANGVRPDEAAYHALSIVNYSRKGSSRMLQVLLPLVPFLNARIQGLARLGGGAVGPKGALSRKRAFLQLALNGAILSAVSAALWGWNESDDDRRRQFEAEPLHRRLNYHILYLGQDKVLIPKAFEIGAIFSTLPEMMMAAAKGETDELAPAAVQTLVNTFSFNPIPAALLPAIEDAANYSFFTNQPVESQRFEGMLPRDRVDPQTSAIARVLGQTWLANWAGMSPIRIQHLLEGYGGAPTAALMTATDVAAGDLGLLPSRPQGAFGAVPGVSSLSQEVLGSMFKQTDADSSNRFLGSFYDMKTAVTQVYRSAKQAREAGDVQRFNSIIGDAPAGAAGTAAAYRLVNKTGTAISDLNGQIRAIEADRKMPPEEKRTKLIPLVNARNLLSERVYKEIRALEERSGETFAGAS